MLQNGWVPVALSVDVEAGTSCGTRIEGREVVVWRDHSGVAHVWQDRCPHRGMRLSFGFVRGDHLACLYHGWQFAPDGQCRLIPAHPDIKVPSTIKATIFRCVERAGMIWTGDGPGLPDDAPVTPVRSVFIEVPMPQLRAQLPAEGEALLCRYEIEGLSVTAGLQPVGECRSALHLVIAGEHGAAARHQVSKWAMALRARMEEPA